MSKDCYARHDLNVGIKTSGYYNTSYMSGMASLCVPTRSEPCQRQSDIIVAVRQNCCPFFTRHEQPVYDILLLSDTNCLTALAHVV